MKKNTTIIIAIIVIIVLAVGGYAIFHKSPKTTPAATTSNTTATTPPATTKSATTSDVIQTKTSSTYGQYLTDANGNTLYTFGGDTAGVSNCTGACIATWPAYAPTTSTTSLPTNVTIIKRSDGTSQYAYKGLPLYTFTGDSSPGQITGEGDGDFHIVKP